MPSLGGKCVDGSQTGAQRVLPTELWQSGGRVFPLRYLGGGTEGFWLVVPARPWPEVALTALGNLGCRQPPGAHSDEVLVVVYRANPARFLKFHTPLSDS